MTSTTHNALTAGGRTSLDLPTEIWCLVAQELAGEADFATLFHLALTSKGMAGTVLPFLYQACGRLPALDDPQCHLERSACFWRSLIASSLGGTLFEYCCWIKDLRLNRLRNFLVHLPARSALEYQFFRPPIEDFRVMREDSSTVQERIIANNTIVKEVATMVTRCILTWAERENKPAAITSVDAGQFGWPAPALPGWLSNFSRLTSLVLNSGSLLNVAVARAIRANCPAFRELKCGYCKGVVMDAKLADFFQALEPNTLETFATGGPNSLGRQAFRGLCLHSKSLKTLALLRLTLRGLWSLDELRPCHALESLRLETAWFARPPMGHHHRPLSRHVYEGMVQWLRHCTALREVDFEYVPMASSILGEILPWSDVRLKNLSLRLTEVDVRFFLALRGQEGLERLRIEFQDIYRSQFRPAFRRILFRKALCRCQKLRALETNERFELEDLDSITGSLPAVEDLALNCSLLDDKSINLFRRCTKLKSLDILGPSTVSPDALLGFLAEIGNHPEGQHDGLRVRLGSQLLPCEFTQDEETRVALLIRDRFRGGFVIEYWYDAEQYLVSLPIRWGLESWSF
ncbi:hypothetical protein C8A03DRAFT_29895 [Achaetomium macrosporum]|uniref:Uncharacterized protein n=1 Tax=Achaetomium macrosporum TaxID=79813 RepID=A0AAN7HH60_9PEZI|nr:hypothetical protein C8A03DRAFT_29895 [Achaetomium macrosporum]